MSKDAEVKRPGLRQRLGQRLLSCGARLIERGNRLVATEEEVEDFGTQPPSLVIPDRIAAWLTEHEYHFQRFDDGEIGGIWDGNPHWFTLVGDDKTYLQVRGKWRHDALMLQRSEVLQIVNDWNREYLWPKVYVRRDDEGTWLFAEVTTSLPVGATDAQLATLLDMSLGTANSFFDTLPKPENPELTAGS
ncbi:MAG: YbjN domain-containing protein [Promicromonosporaceae bacterium]|nr:YbjN domain-containing protein [Promicromonosporaceae bacterium]